MLVNISIASLIASSLSKSPFFSARSRYSLDLCQFNRFFPTIFFQIPNLRVRDSYFARLQSEIVYSDSHSLETFDNAEFNKINNDDTIFIKCRFINIKNLQVKNLISDIVSFEECLFNLLNPTSDFLSIDSKQLNVIGCCFSDVNCANLINRQSLGESTIFQDNIIINFNCESIILTSTLNFLCMNCNFTGNKAQDLLSFDARSRNNEYVSLRNSLISQNEFSSLAFIDDLNTIFNITASFIYGNQVSTQKLSKTSFLDPSCAILYIFSDIVSITDSIFWANSKINTDDSGLALSLFAALRTTQYCTVYLVNNKFSYMMYDSLSMIGASSNTYTLNEAIYNEYTTPIISINYYLYENYRKECNIYLYPTSYFSASSAFTPSNVFSPSNYFITPSASPSSSQSASPSDTPTMSLALPTMSPSVNPTYAIIGAFGTAIVSFGLAGIIWISIRSFCIYDHNNYLHMDV